MAEVTSNMSFTQPSAAQMHTLQRHRDILKDYSQEFTKTKVCLCYIGGYYMVVWRYGFYFRAMKTIFDEWG